MNYKGVSFCILLSVFFICFISFWGCDYVSNPIIPKQVNGTLPSTPPTFINSSSNYNVYKLLLEDCGGHTCANCPKAETVAETILQSSIGSQVVFVEDELGSNADTVTISRTPTPLPDSAFRKDYTCLAGNNWATEFSITFYPWGMLNRSGPSNTFIPYGSYSHFCDSVIAGNTQSVAINIHDSCWTSPRIIGTEFQLTFKKVLSGTYLLVTEIVEDSVIDWQEDNSLPTYHFYDSAYVHRFVLRGSFDYTSGTNAGTGIAIPQAVSSVAGGTWTSYQTYDFTKGEKGKAAGWNMAHCYIVAFVYGSSGNSQNPYQVVQAEMIKVE